MSRRALTVLAGLLVVVLAFEAWVLWLRPEPGPTADRPVTISDVRQAAALDAASSAVAEILTTGFADYDAQSKEAQDLMTKGFATKYASTSADIKDAFVKAKTQVDVKVAWAGTYRAGEDSVQALLFLDQVVTRNGADARTVPFRALVTVVPDGDGWLVSDIDTR